MSCNSLTKRPGENRLFPVQFLSDYGTFVIASVSVLVTDADGYNVTDLLIDPTYTTFTGNTAQFMAINGTEGAQYTIALTAEMTDHETLIWEGSLTILDG